VILGHPKQNKIMGFWSDALGTAGEAYAENQRAERERAAAERERQRNLPANKQSTWLLLGIGDHCPDRYCSFLLHTQITYEPTNKR
jgi:hypothetical protein